jgi:hypothetical protein
MVDQVDPLRVDQRQSVPVQVGLRRRAWLVSHVALAEPFGRPQAAVAVAADAGDAIALQQRRKLVDHIVRAEWGTPLAQAVDDHHVVLPVANRQGSGTQALVFDFFVSVGTVTMSGQSGTLTYDFTPAVAAVPEPSTWAMMTLGFGLMGFLGYRKTRGALA